MCKFCKMKTLNKEIGEKSNGNKYVTGITDGTQSFDLYLNRYAIENEGLNRAQLWLELAVHMENGLFPLKEKAIDIKYCPFCGEEL